MDLTRDEQMRATKTEVTAGAATDSLRLIVNEGWWTARGSNSRPPHCERGALPTELAAHVVRRRRDWRRRSHWRANRDQCHPSVYIRWARRQFTSRSNTSFSGAAPSTIRKPNTAHPATIGGLEARVLAGLQHDVMRLPEQRVVRPQTMRTSRQFVRDRLPVLQDRDLLAVHRHIDLANAGVVRRLPVTVMHAT